MKRARFPELRELLVVPGALRKELPQRALANGSLDDPTQTRTIFRVLEAAGELTGALKSERALRGADQAKAKGQRLGRPRGGDVDDSAIVRDIVKGGSVRGVAEVAEHTQQRDRYRRQAEREGIGVDRL